VVLDPAARSRMRWIGVADATVKVAA
jgi:hypothetical protein